ncbi:MAG: PD-(D/E)XK nuclease family protein [Burkholderiales bacterium]
MRLSRSKIELFQRCPRCFWLTVNAKIRQPSGPPFSLNIAVDHLFKNEFDAYRGGSIVPPRLAAAGIQCIPAAHPDLQKWRHNFTGVSAQHEPTGYELFGAIDDLWVDSEGVHYVVDYKATSKKSEVSLDADWQISYKRQAEFYQWLLRRNGLPISDRAWFVYTNGIADDAPFDDVLRFRTRLIPYDGDDSWVEPALESVSRCLSLSAAPQSGSDCEQCQYVDKVMQAVSPV